MNTKIILVGSVAVGKTTIKNLLEAFGLSSEVSYTTRSIRSGEIDGVDYNFISKEEFQNDIDNERFLQYVEFNDNFYGTHEKEFVSKNIFIMSPSGLSKIPEKYWNNNKIMVIYLYAKQNHLRERMIQRGMTNDQIEKRLEADKKEFADLEHFPLSYDTSLLSPKELASKILIDLIP